MLFHIADMYIQGRRNKNPDDSTISSLLGCVSIGRKEELAPPNQFCKNIVPKLDFIASASACSYIRFLESLSKHLTWDLAG